MKIDEFKLERTLSRFQNEVDYDLSASGIYPMFIDELISSDEMKKMYTDLQLRYVHTIGTKGLRTAISTFYDDMDPANAFPTNGSAEGLFITAWSLLDKGDEMAFMVPNFMLMAHVAESHGIKIRPFHLNADDGWSLNLDELKRAVNPKTKIIAVCNPNNPTGTVLKESEMREIVKVADSVGAYILSDEVYRGAEQNGETTRSFWGMYDKVVVIGGLSKAFGLPGLRLGWIGAPEEVIDKAWFYHDFLTTTVTTVSDYLGTIALQPEMRERIFTRNRKIISENLPQFTRWVEGYKGKIAFTPPRAGCFAFVRYDLGVSSWDLVMEMVENHSVFVIPGSVFNIEKHLRINFGVSRETLTNGLARIDEALKKYGAQAQ